jgi:hypothetical protein
MRWNQIAARAGTVLAAGAVCAASSTAPAFAAQAGSRPAGLGQFANWKPAQKAAGFRLLMPTRTFKHVRNGDLIVTRCAATVKKKKAAHRVVIANYGLTPFSTLALYQNNLGSPCSSIGKVTMLRKVKVNGTTAQLSGKCGMKGLRSCKSSKIFLFLTWTKKHIYYMATSFGEPSKTLIGFATGLRPVR